MGSITLHTLKSKIEQLYCQHEIKKITKMIPKHFLVFLLSTITICNCHYMYHSGYHYNTRSNMVWFEANEPEDCREAPEEVSEEALPTDICDGAAAKDKRCLCIGYNYTTYFYGQPQESSGEITYLPWCGVCRDPCALQFKWDASFTILPEEEEEGSGAMEVIEDVAEEVAEVPEEAADVVEEVADAAEVGRSIDVSDIINNVAEEVAEVTEEAADVVEELVDVAVEASGDIAEESAKVSEEVADVAEDAAEVVEETSDTVEEASNDLAEEAAGIVEEVTEAAEKAVDVVEEVPEEAADVVDRVSILQRKQVVTLPKNPPKSA